MSDQRNNLADLPKSNDEFWDGAETMQSTVSPIGMCPEHFGGSWMNHQGYKQSDDGLITCIKCPWGTRAPGYIKVVEGKIVDLRTLKGD